MSFPLTPIGEVLSPITTWNPSRIAGSTTFRYIDLSSVDRDEKAVSATTQITVSEAPSRARQLVKTGDILVSTVRPNLNAVAVVDDELDGATASTGFSVLRPATAKATSRYIYHWVRTPVFVTDMVRKATGASYPAVSDRIVAESLIPLPPLPEQRRIAGILDAADALRRRRREALALLDTLPGAIFAEMFGDPAINERGWPARPVGEVCELLNGKAFKPSDWTDEGIPIIRIQNLNDPKKPFNRTLRRFDDRFYIRKGDCLFSWSGTPGTSFGCFDWQGPEGWLNQHIFKVTTAPDVAPSFFRHQMNIRMGELIAKAHGGVGLQHVTKGMITEMNFLVPPEDDQSRFVDAVARHDQNVFQGRQHLAHLDSLFASLQSRAFAGEL